MNVTMPGRIAHREPATARTSAPPPSALTEMKRQFCFGLGAALAAGIFSGLAGYTSPARADQGMEREPGGLLYKYLDRYDPRPTSRRRARLPVRPDRHEREDDDSDRSSAGRDDDYGDETTRRRRPATRHRTSRRTPHHRRAAHRQGTDRRKRIRVASLGAGVSLPDVETRPRKSVTGGAGVVWVASAGCLNSRLRAAIYHVAQNYGRVRVNSTCRGRRHNRRVGGARHSWHLSGNAADIRIWGNVRAAARYLRSLAGGYKHYGGGLFHIDTGPRRTW
jgi:Peptidase M15